MTPLQKLQQQRVWFKFKLTGMVFNINPQYLTQAEREKLDIIKRNISELKDIHDDSSRVLGLNVPMHKCWCNKKAVTQVDYYNDGNLKWVCKKHEEL